MRAILGLVVLGVAACDRDLGTPPSSQFADEDPFARQLAGRVVRGTESVAGAIVQVEPAPGLASDERLRATGDPGYLTSSDLGGSYHVLNGPFFYDLSIRQDREVSVFRGVGVRYFEPTIGSDAPVRGFTATVAANTDPAPSPGNAVAFFVSGPEARTVSGDAASLLVTFRHFEAVLTLHAVEYVQGGGLAAARRVGRADVRVVSGGAVSTVVPMSAIDDPPSSNDVTFEAVPPAGFALSTLELGMDLGLRTSARGVARVAAGTPVHLRIVGDARYFVRATAARDGAVSDSGLLYFSPWEKKVALTLPPPAAEQAFDGGGGFRASAEKGLVEHVLVPMFANGTTLRIATADRATRLPELLRLGLSRPTGSYAWTVQNFPTLTSVENLSGEDVRLVSPVSTTAPRPIEL